MEVKCDSAGWQRRNCEAVILHFQLDVNVQATGEPFPRSLSFAPLSSSFLLPPSLSHKAGVIKSKVMFSRMCFNHAAVCRAVWRNGGER